LLLRAAWQFNAKRIYRLYSEEALTVTRPQRKKLVRCQRTPQPAAERIHQRWGWIRGGPAGFSENSNQRYRSATNLTQA
jgi:hypothetical protein